MSSQTFHTLDVLRLEVEQPPATGLRNRIKNPDGVGGGWGWITPQTNQNIGGLVDGSGPYLSFASMDTFMPGEFGSEPIPARPGQWVNWRAEVRSTNRSYQIGLQHLNADGTVVGGFMLLASTATGVRSGSAHQITDPTVVAVRLRAYQVGGGAPPWGFSWRKAMVAVEDTNTGMTGMAYTETQWVNILGKSHSVQIERSELNLGILAAVVYDADLDPAQAGVHLGQGIRAHALVAGSWEPLHVGSLTNARAEYNPLATDVDKRAKITLTATDAAGTLGRVPRPDGVATIPDLIGVLEGAGVPWNINGSTSQRFPGPTVSTNPDARAIDQVAITRDTVHGYAWISRAGVLTAWDADQLPTGVAAVLDEDDMTALSIDYDTDRCINIVTVKYLRPGGEEVTYGPYVDQASREQWGEHTAEFTVHGIPETEANMAAFANAVFAANATPQRRVNTVTLPVRTPAELPKTLLDLYDLVTVQNADLDLDQSMRITGVRHQIATDRWSVTLEFAAQGGVAPPQQTPSAGPTVAAGAGEWVAAAPTNGWTGAVYYNVADGMCTAILDLFKTAWGAEVMAQLPPGAIPKPALPAGMYFYGLSRDTGAQAPFWVGVGGDIGCVFGSAVTGGGGITGTITYPVRR
ncbi:hypothetical protein [Nocardioides soli]|uniref:Uncharacterized protein n=1 Tax=Nocardioides soli TaxID=1036020 RepID=A0A7W4VTN3_9ACTN|nr:hypothetical protein [Nocardioides soli]MBB3041159.1 hypothetical protein [Nocardioides soli]